MKNRISILLVMLLAGGVASTQVLRNMTPRYTNPSVKGNITFVSNNIVSSSGVITTEAPPGGSAVNNGNPGINIDIDGIPPTSFFSYGTNWKYLDNDTRPAGWETTAFADGGWASGPGLLGYDDGDVVTCVRSNAAPVSCTPTGNKYITTYFRKSITVVNPTVFSDFTMNVFRDDGIVIYVNGVEQVRSNMPAGPIAHGTFASTCAPDDGDVIQVFTIPSSAFSAGTNVIAVEIHQCTLTSSDLVFGMELIGNPNTNTTFIPYGASWKYLDNNTRPANWETSGYSDVAWSTGNAQFGYGDGDESTCVASGGGGTLCMPTGTKYTTTYFRKTVTIPNTALFANFIINLIRDDGAVVYVNGVEVLRNNMPTGAIAHGTFASSNINGAAESTPVTYYIPTSAFVNGVNTIAVEVHQIDATSSDLSFDFQLLGTTDETFNSSSADLVLPSCSNILFAGLYWGATQGTNGTNTLWILNETSVKLKIPGSSTFQNITSSQTDYHNDVLVPGLPHTGYRCFADITSLVNAGSPNGTYTIGNVVSPLGINNSSGGWTIVIAYSDPSTIVRNLTVFDGSVIMNGGDPALHVPISGFLTPPSGPVSCELGAVVFDGDRGSIDEFSFKQNSNPLIGVYTSLTPNATSNLNDMWNSTISRYGSVVTSRVPAHNNTLGYDADILTVPNAGNVVLGNSQSSASIRFSSPSENYMLQVATTAISQYTPTFNVSKNATDLTGGSLVPGDSIRYQIAYQNGGNDASTGTTIIDNIPAGTSYAPNSLMIDGVAKTDAVGDDEAEYDFPNNRVLFRLGIGATGTTGGEVNPAVSGNVTFKVYTPASCAVFACNSTISNRARMSYGGKLSLLSLYDSSGVLNAGCNDPGPQVNLITGTCMPLQDTILTNTCPSLTVRIPIARYAGYVFHTAMPFTVANTYDPRVPVTTTRLIYAYYNGPGSCDDTIRINIFITGCPDIDDDDDGLPDYLEFNTSVAIADQDMDGIPNWADPTPGAPILWVDNNIDGSNDWYDPAADADNDGVLNFYDTDFPGYVDSNGDGVNDNMDKDLDGLPNNFDIDSDNDGIPDTVESFGVDTNGDGRIDNYSDPDNDGLSQNVDASGVGANYIRGSGLGLGAIDTDGDGLPNYLDLDSDNDGIPDIIEALGSDPSNDGKISLTVDVDGDGLLDALDGDVGNDLIAENSANALLRTGSDINNDGRTDSWPFKNMDGDSKPNAYDLDSDGDGITDVKEANFTDADWNGRIDGSINTDGWNTGIAGAGSLTLPNTDGVGRVNVYDIDADDDGIPDNVEGLTTIGYLLPAYADSDGDGIDNSYDNFNGFGGDGIHPCDTDADTVPDYLDSDTDGDGTIDRVEGNDLNFNSTPDDLVTLTGLDTDGDGLDNRFDNDNASTKATSRYMGNGGTTSGENPPGSTTTVQRSPLSTWGCPFERDWRCVFYVLNCDIITVKASLQQEETRLNWTVLCDQEVDYFIVERSTDRVNFSDVARVEGRATVNAMEHYASNDNVSMLPSGFIYYRLRTVLRNGKAKQGNIIVVKKDGRNEYNVQILPNPVREQLQVLVSSPLQVEAEIQVIDGNGKRIQQYKEMAMPGVNSYTYRQVASLPVGIYYMRLKLGNTIINKKFSVIK